MEPDEKQGLDFSGCEARMAASDPALVVHNFTHSGWADVKDSGALRHLHEARMLALGTGRETQSAATFVAHLAAEAEQLQKSLRGLSEAHRKSSAALQALNKAGVLFGLGAAPEPTIAFSRYQRGRLLHHELEQELELYDVSVRTMQPAVAKPKNLRPGPAVKGKKGKVRKW